MNSIKVLFSSLDAILPHEDPDRPHKDFVLDDSPEITPDLTPSVSEDAAPENPRASWLWLLFKALFFIPNWVFIKPLVLLWSVLVSPIAYLSKSSSYATVPELADLNEKTELIKQENIIANDIKSPTSSSKYIIPPPQRLFPLIRYPTRYKRRKVLVLDLDETLIHSLSKGSPRSLNNSNSNVIEIKLNNIATLYHVHKRPYCDYFLKEISGYFELQIFTASVKEYADPIIDWLENEITDHATTSKIFTKRYYRTDCTYRNGVGYIKDLSKFFPSDDLKNVVILDNSPVSYALHENNAVTIEGWINDQNDRDLVNLLPMLQSLSLCIDVRFILGLRQGEKVFECY